MASRVSAAPARILDLDVVDVEDDDDDTAASTPAALRARARSRITTSGRTPSFPDAFSSSAAAPKRPAPASPILVEDDTPPPPPKRRQSVAPGSVVPETPDWHHVPCSLPRSRATTPDTPDSVLRSSSRFGFDSPDPEIPGPAFPPSIDADIVVLETPGFTTPRPSRAAATVPDTPQSFVPCSLDPRPGDAAPEMPDPALPLDFDSPDPGFPGPAVPGSTDPDIVDLDTPDPVTASRPSGAATLTGAPHSFVPCSLSPQPRGGAVPAMPHSVLPRSFEFDFDAAAAADLGIPGLAFPGSVDPNTTRFCNPSLFDVAGPSTLPGPSSPISLDSDDELDDFGYEAPLSNLILPCEDSTLQEEENNNNAEERKTKQGKRKLIKEGKAKLIEEKKQQREENKLLKEATKAQKAEQKKYAKEKEEWESGKHALKSIVAEIDSTIIESGSLGGTLLTRFSEKSLKYRVQVNPLRGSILWKMEVPPIGEDPASVSEVPYILFVLQAEEFCDLISSGFFVDHVREVQSRYPTFTICYVTNKLMNYINKCERTQYRNPSCSNSWKRPPVEEVFCKLVTHYARVHSRQCLDEAEVAEHVVGLTSSLANCKFRKPLSWLSVHANGAVIPKNFIDKDLAKKDTWMKALIAIPKVQPRFALAIWKKYSTMRSLLNVYMDPTKTDREKELLLQDLKCEDRVGEESRRVGPVCSKRVYKTLMAQDGGMEADAAE
ncbi:crossover junction endonuclease EME1-like [Lolium rigidum]|uniref:crossover junction endonuclease EME1-like n=1 Tax=Lolium rigidum TaxID=89674 RepID=UPI001F5C2824|nr:crossover junction endonuclease EME1-like [Lolium rigidum]